MTGTDECYVSLAPCGCLCALIVKDTYGVAKWIKKQAEAGRTIKLVPCDDVRRLQFTPITRCPHVEQRTQA